MPAETLQLKKDILYIKPELDDSFSDEVLIEEIKSQIFEKSTTNLVLDLGNCSLFLSVRVGALISAYHFTEFPFGKLFIVVNSRQAKRFIQTLSFSNTTVIYNQEAVALEKIA
jgi:anti-anti-sigma regulatory factor